MAFSMEHLEAAFVVTALAQVEQFTNDQMNIFCSK